MRPLGLVLLLAPFAGARRKSGGGHGFQVTRNSPRGPGSVSTSSAPSPAACRAPSPGPAASTGARRRLGSPELRCRARALGPVLLPAAALSRGVALRDVSVPADGVEPGAACRGRRGGGPSRSRIGGRPYTSRQSRPVRSPSLTAARVRPPSGRRPPDGPGERLRDRLIDVSSVRGVLRVDPHVHIVTLCSET